MDMTAWQATVREHLLAVWGEQSCQRLSDWPDVLARLLKDSPPTPGGSGYGRGGLAPAVDDAVTALAWVFGNGVPANPASVARRCFFKLDHAHAAQLAQRLIAARGERQAEATA